MTIQIDSREKRHIINRILGEFDSLGVRWFISKLNVGDYMSMDNARLVIDRKQNLGEVAKNFCEPRFTREMARAKDLGITIVFLIEHGGKIKELRDVAAWKNPRLAESPMAPSGERIYKRMIAFSGFYGVRWEFCDKRQTGHRIVEILRRGEVEARGQE